MDIYLGTLSNALMIVAGATIGVLFKKNDRLKVIGQRIFEVYALFIIAMGVNGAADLSNALIIIISLMIGVAIGELMDLDKRFNNFSAWVQNKFEKSTKLPTNSKFAQGFTQATLLFCIGSMTFMGAFEAASQHTHTVYLTKGVIDGISAITIAMGTGVGAAFSALCVLIYQGILVSLAALLSGVLTDGVISLCCTIGSLFLVGIGLNMLGITKLKVANFIPAMFMPIFISLLPFVNL